MKSGILSIYLFNFALFISVMIKENIAQIIANIRTANAKITIAKISTAPSNNFFYCLYDYKAILILEKAQNILFIYL